MTQHIAPNDLKLIDTQPRVMDLRLAETLGFERNRKIRDLIKRNSAELSTHGEVFATMAKTDIEAPHGGARQGTEFWLNEPQSLLICMFARTDRAAAARTELIRVFMDWRAQQASASKPAPDVLAEFPAADGPLAEHMAKLATLRECRMIHGPRAAARLWKRLGMPAVEHSAIEEKDEGRLCLAYLLETVAVDDPHFGDDLTLRDMLSAALDGDDDAARALRERFGLLAVRDAQEGLFVPNCGRVPELFKGSAWACGRHVAALRRLPGTEAQRRSIGLQHRGTFIPHDLIERMPLPAPAGDNVVPLR